MRGSVSVFQPRLRRLAFVLLSTVLASTACAVLGVQRLGGGDLCQAVLDEVERAMERDNGAEADAALERAKLTCQPHQFAMTEYRLKQWHARAPSKPPASDPTTAGVVTVPSSATPSGTPPCDWAHLQTCTTTATEVATLLADGSRLQGLISMMPPYIDSAEKRSTVAYIDGRAIPWTKAQQCIQNYAAFLNSWNLCLKQSTVADEMKPGCVKRKRELTSIPDDLTLATCGFRYEPAHQQAARLPELEQRFQQRLDGEKATAARAAADQQTQQRRMAWISADLDACRSRDPRFIRAVAGQQVCARMEGLQKYRDELRRMKEVDNRSGTVNLYQTRQLTQAIMILEEKLKSEQQQYVKAGGKLSGSGDGSSACKEPSPDDIATEYRSLATTKEPGALFRRARCHLERFEGDPTLYFETLDAFDDAGKKTKLFTDACNLGLMTFEESSEDDIYDAIFLRAVKGGGDTKMLDAAKKSRLKAAKRGGASADDVRALDEHLSSLQRER